jgi:hypothetical protein
LAALYAAGVVVATVGGWVAVQKLGDHDQPAARLLLWSVIAGVLWPVLLLGIVQIGMWMLAKKSGRVGPNIPSASRPTSGADRLTLMRRAVG